MGLCVPTPGWIAARLASAGAPLALALLGVAVTLNDGKASDSDINDWYRQLAETDDAVWAVNQHYIALEAAYPFLSGHLAAITRWTEEPALHQYDQLRAGAACLTDIEWSAAEPRADGDLLGMVWNQMLAIGARRTRVFDYATIEDAYMGLLERGWGLTGQPRSFIDAWCGAGTRAIGAHQLLTDLGRRTDIIWRFNDPSPMAVALCGLNVVGHSIGPDVKLSCNREWANQWAASSMWAISPTMLRTLPPELALDAPLPPEVLGSEDTLGLDL